MSAANGGGTDAFAGFEPDAYHRWRLESELYRSVEKPVVLSMLREIPFRRALDIGCGTGLWTCTLKDLHPEADTLGIDISSEMISFAEMQCDARFEAVDAPSFRDARRFDLIISALSADYIGLPPFLTTVAANLSETGTGFAWLLDPRRYPCEGNRRVKTWDIGGRQVRVEIPDYDVDGMAGMCADAGLHSSVVETRFRLRDGIERHFLCFRYTVV